MIILGSGGAAILTACIAAEAGLEVAVLERSSQLGGTTAVSGGMLWIGNNGLSEQIGVADSREEVLIYLDRVTDASDRSPLEAFVDNGPELIKYLHDNTPVRLFPIDRPDYNAHWLGGKHGGRVLDNSPFTTADHVGVADNLRVSPHFPPLTYDERHRWRWPERFDQDLIESRKAGGVRTLGGALAGGLLAAALERGVRFVTNTRATGLTLDDRGSSKVSCESGGHETIWQSGRAVVLGAGGFEWSNAMRSSFLAGPAAAPVSPPWNTGDSLRMAMSAGAMLANMSEAWWAPTYQVPGETYDEEPMTRHMIDDLALPGTILVNRLGRRFVNEAINYNDMSKTFQHFDPAGYDYPNVPAFLIFDARVKGAYSVATIPGSVDAPEWFRQSDSLDELAARTGIDREGLVSTVADFNRGAREGVDPQFERGQRALDRYYGDPEHLPNPSLGTVELAPFYAVEVIPGLLGTKGGARTDTQGRALDHRGRPIKGLWAVGNAAASIMGPGYPGAGGSLGPLLVGSLLCGRAISA